MMISDRTDTALALARVIRDKVYHGPEAGRPVQPIHTKMAARL